MQLESLAKKLRKESDALKRLEASQAKRNGKEDEEEPIVVEDVTETTSTAPRKLLR
jgi:hypothetical protein